MIRNRHDNRYLPIQGRKYDCIGEFKVWLALSSLVSLLSIYLLLCFAIRTIKATLYEHFCQDLSHSQTQTTYLVMWREK
jgi:hypothetical protein